MNILTPNYEWEPTWESTPYTRLNKLPQRRIQRKMPKVLETRDTLQPAKNTVPASNSSVLTPEEEKFFRNYKTATYATAAASGIADIAGYVTAVLDEINNRRLPRPAPIKHLAYSPERPILTYADQELRDIDRGFVSGLTLARKMGRPEIVPAMLAQRDEQRGKIFTEMGRQNLQSILQTSNQNARTRMAVESGNRQIDQINLSSRMAHDQMVAQAIQTNRQMQESSMKGILNTASGLTNNILTANILKNRYKYAKESGDMAGFLDYINNY